MVEVAKQLDDLKNKCNKFSSVSLELAEHIIEVLFISSRKVGERIVLTIRKCETTSQPQLKYLAVIYNASLRMMANRGCGVAAADF